MIGGRPAAVEAPADKTLPSVPRVVTGQTALSQRRRTRPLSSGT